MPVIFSSLVIFGILLLFSRTKIGKILLAVFVLNFVVYITLLALQEESYIRFVEDNNLTIDRRSNNNPNSKITWPWYASDENNYYVLVPGYYRVMPKENNCQGFNRFDEETWCIESVDDYKCYPYTDLGADEGCAVFRIDQ